MIVGTFHLSSWSWLFFEFLNLMTWESFICHLKWDGAGSTQFWTKSCEIITASKKVQDNGFKQLYLDTFPGLSINNSKRISIFMTSDVIGENLVPYWHMGSESNRGLSTGCNCFTLQFHQLSWTSWPLSLKAQTCGKWVLALQLQLTESSQNSNRANTTWDAPAPRSSTRNIYFSPNAPYYCCCTYNVHNVHTLRVHTRVWSQSSHAQWVVVYQSNLILQKSLDTCVAHTT